MDCSVTELRLPLCHCMDSPLELDPAFTHMIRAGDSVVLVGDEVSAVLEGDGVAELIRLVDGVRNAAEVVAAMPSVAPEVVHFALLRLEGSGVLREVENRGARGEPIVGDGEWLRAAWVDRANPRCHAVVVDGVGEVLLSDDYLAPEVERVARAAAARVLLTRIGPRDVWVGPWVGGRDDACFHCLARRLATNLTARALQHDLSRRDSLAVERLDRPVEPAVFPLLATAIERYEAGLQQFRLDGSRVTHPLPRVPGCPECGQQGGEQTGGAITLRRRPLVDGSGGGYRVCPAQETWARYSGLISPLTGIVRHVERVESPAPSVHVYTASHFGTYAATSVKAVRSDARDHSGGKGITDIDARVSALCEALERTSAVHRGSEAVRRAAYSGLSEPATAPNDILLFSEAQLEGRERWNRDRAGGFHFVPEPYGDQAIDWVRASNLTGGEDRWLPAAQVFFAYHGAGFEFGRADSNGLAGGNCLEEAILQGLLELVERDAIALWWYSRGSVPGVAVESAEDPRLLEILTDYRRLGRRLWALDLTSDIGIPCYVAVSAREGSGPDDLIFGFGCHVDGRVAMRRAVTEVGQMLTAVSGSRTERRARLLADFPDAIAWWETASLESQPYLLPTGESREVALPGSAGSDVGEVLEDCVAMVSARGLEVLAYDLTRSDVELSVAKVVAPGLRHFWRRLGPGRLYDVPPRIGWVPSMLTEDELNPVSLFV